MFTGIIEEQGKIRYIEKTSEKSFTLTISAKDILSDIAQGDSIAINGICLTVTAFTAEDFAVDVMPGTMASTSLHALDIYSKVNLERAMAANGRFGGHFVSGHVDGTGEIIHKVVRENAIEFSIKIPKACCQWVIPKGSITIDGISLTVFRLEGTIITISIIPHTAAVTTLGEKEIGDVVNVEYDMLGKYIQRMIPLGDSDRP